MVIITPHSSNFHGVRFGIDKSLRYHNGLLLGDRIRMRAYEDALKFLEESGIKPQKIVEVGSGPSAPWATWLAYAFPDAQVFAVEREPNLAKELRKNLDFPNAPKNLEVICADATRLTLSEIDVAVTELDGGLGNNERAYELFNHIQRWMSPQGIILPYKMRHFIAPVSVPGIEGKMPGFENLQFYQEGFNPKIIGHYQRHPFKLYYAVFGLKKDAFLSEPQLLDSVITSEPITAKYPKRFEFVIGKSATMNGFIVYFSHEFFRDDFFVNGKNVVLSTEPERYKYDTAWGQAYFPIHTIDVRRGDIIGIKLLEDTSIRNQPVRYNWAVLKRGSPIGDYSTKLPKISKRK